jgi:hypothetical protein
MDEGQNLELRTRNRSCNMKAGTEKREEKPKAHRESTVRKAGGYL